MTFRRRALGVLVALTLTGWAVPAEANDPQAEAEIRRVLQVIATIKLTDPTTKRRIETLLADEALGNWQQGRFVRFLEAPESIHVLADGRAVARYQRQGQRIRHDVYVHLTHDPVWRVVAMRAMARTEMLLDEKQTLEGIWFRSPEQNARLENLKLSLATDRELRQWFGRHEKALDAVVQLYRKAVNQTPVSVAPTDPYALAADPPPPSAPPLTAEQQAAASDVAARCQALHVAGVDVVPEDEAPGKDDQAPIKVIVGGVLDDTVGFVHAPAGPPLVSPNRLIWVEPLGRDWYLVRTT